ncbi:peptidase inhibitor family I36 protein [Rugosimonospora africana]|uniref:Peptidase inhibitor family I36 n=1 Tax=Rugosimonospora africana TaxID=556532 RepID=A0A8J3QVI1_9ACTN|nr:peptidase inhibitor family I36 protein [Rugosimonospora africana]GIH16862.1 hypothetical protein Raf01_50340 [Rugosimonospora africana]
MTTSGIRDSRVAGPAPSRGARFRRSWRRWAPLATVPLVAVLALAAPAQAASPRAAGAALTVTASNSTSAAPAADGFGCPSGDFCFWVDINFGKFYGELSAKNADWTKLPNPQCRTGNWNDCASSVDNQGVNCTAVGWWDTGYQGHYIFVSRGETLSDLTWYAWVDTNHQEHLWNDAISSNSWRTPDLGTNSTCTGP